MPNLWLHAPHIPKPAAGVLAAMHLTEPDTAALTRFTDREWRDALEFAIPSQITLPFRRRVRDVMPANVRDITDRNLADNRQRLAIAEDLYRLLEERLAAVGIEFLALKGLTHCPDFGTQPEDRLQTDIDLYCPRENVFAARDSLMAVGFEPLDELEAFPTDHIPALVRKTGWQWRGNVFDPEMPIAVELHFRFWNPDLERLPAPGVDEFWSRRITRRIAGGEIRALCPQDALAYAALHLVRHLFRGKLRPFHVYEVACFLHDHADDNPFWQTWNSLHSPELRRIEAIAFAIADAWFGCRLGPAQNEMDLLPARARRWFADFAAAPIAGRFRPNKDELWLHLALLPSGADRWAVARRRLFPERLPGPVGAINVPQSEKSLALRMKDRARWLSYVASRIRHHALSAASLARSGFRWWLA